MVLILNILLPGLAGLVELDLSHNNLHHKSSETYKPFEHLSGLKKLILNNNKLTFISGDFFTGRLVQ